MPPNPKKRPSRVTLIDSLRIAELLERYGRALVLFARQWCHCPDDALQEALLELATQPTIPEDPVAWLFVTVKRRAMNFSRGEGRRLLHHQRAAEIRPTWFETNSHANLEVERLQELLSQLPSVDRQILVARIWGELTFEQIAQLVEGSSSSIHRRYHKALNTLREQMSEVQPES